MPAKRVTRWLSLSVFAVVACTAWGKDPAPTLPNYVLEAHTAAVLVDPEAGVNASDPNANQVAQKDVETALLKWGRLIPVLSPLQADIVIVIRKGSGKLADVTISDPRQNSRPGSVTQTDDSVSVAVQHGPRPPVDGNPAHGSQADGTSTPRPRVEAGQRDDSFQVYEGKTSEPLDGAIVWRYDHKNALHSHDVPAVDQFRKAIAAAEKQAQQNHP